MTHSPTQTPRTHWETCDNCQAPLDEGQRYCVACGTRRPGADDPAGRYFAAAARRARAAAVPAAGAARPGSGLRTAVVLALIPVAAAIGVQVGRSGTNERVLDALKSQKAPVVKVVGGGAAATAAASDEATVPSDFALDKGFAVQLQTLPVSGTTAADVDSAIKALEAKGIKEVGIVSPDDFSVKPSPGGDVYVLVSGAFEKKADAQDALKGIKKKAPEATVVEVSRKDDGGSAGGGKVISRTEYGSARQLTGDKVTQKDVDESAKAVDHIVNSKGKEYVKQQRNLPDTIVIP